MSRDLHSVSSEPTVTHGRVYNLLASVGEKVERFIDKIIGDEVICDSPNLPFSGSTPGDLEHSPSETRGNSAGK